MVEFIVLGIIQGVAEWLPVSSEGMIFLAQTRLFHHQENVMLLAAEALFLHLGTLLAALLYFRKDIRLLFKAAFHYRTSDLETKKIFLFLLFTTLISGTLGVALLAVFASLTAQVESSAKILTLAIGACLLATGALQLKAPGTGTRSPAELKPADTFFLGVAQGLAALPGLSRSGLTVAALLLRKFEKAQALRLSFLMSIPIVLAGNILLSLAHMKTFNLSLPALAGLASSFIFGLATIHLLLKAAQRINFGYFVIGFGVLTIIAGILP